MEFAVVLSDDALSRVSRLLLEAESLGRGVQAGFAYVTILYHLRTDPLAYGEILYRVPTGPGVYHKVLRPLSVWYAVYEEPRLAWIVRVDRLSFSSEMRVVARRSRTCKAASYHEKGELRCTGH